MNPTDLHDPQATGRTSRTVMIVNGPGAILELFEAILEPGHYDVVVVESGDRAYSQIKRVRPDLVILCIRMQDASTLQVLSMLRLDPETAGVPVVTYPVDDDYPQHVDEVVDLPDDDFWPRSANVGLRMN